MPWSIWPAVRGGVRGVQLRQRGADVVQGQQVAIGVRRQARGGLRPGALGTEHATFRGTERDTAVPRDRDPVAHARIELGRETEDADEEPDPARGNGIRVPGVGRRERVEGVCERIVGGGQGRGGGHLEHHLGERGSPREAPQVARQIAAQVGHVERGHRLQVAGFLVVQLHHTFTERFERRAEGTARAQHALGDGALHAQLARRQAHDLGSLAVAEGLEDDGRRRDERHLVDQRHGGEGRTRRTHTNGRRGEGPVVGGHRQHVHAARTRARAGCDGVHASPGIDGETRDAGAR